MCGEPVLAEAAMASTTTADRAFWAQVGSLFDFTLKFEEIILSISISSAFTALSPFLICYYYFWQPRYISSGPLLWAKLVCRYLPWIAPRNY